MLCILVDSSLISEHTWIYSIYVLCIALSISILIVEAKFYSTYYFNDYARKQRCRHKNYWGYREKTYQFCEGAHVVLCISFNYIKPLESGVQITRPFYLIRSIEWNTARNSYDLILFDFRFMDRVTETELSKQRANCQIFFLDFFFTEIIMPNSSGVHGFNN